MTWAHLGITSQWHLQVRCQLCLLMAHLTSLVAQTVKCLLAMRETWVQSLGREDPVQKEMATHSSTLAWKIPWTEEPDRLPSMGPQRVGHDWVLHFTSYISLTDETLLAGSLSCLNSPQYLRWHLPEDSQIQRHDVLNTSFRKGINFLDCGASRPAKWVRRGPNVQGWEHPVRQKTHEKYTHTKLTAWSINLMVILHSPSITVTSTTQKPFCYYADGFSRIYHHKLSFPQLWYLFN